MESKEREFYIFKLNLTDRICFSIMKQKCLPSRQLKGMCELNETFTKNKQQKKTKQKTKNTTDQNMKRKLMRREAKKGKNKKMEVRL